MYLLKETTIKLNERKDLFPSYYILYVVVVPSSKYSFAATKENCDSSYIHHHHHSFVAVRKPSVAYGFLGVSILGEKAFQF